MMTSYVMARAVDRADHERHVLATLHVAWRHALAQRALAYTEQCLHVDLRVLAAIFSVNSHSSACELVLYTAISIHELTPCRSGFTRGQARISGQNEEPADDPASAPRATSLLDQPARSPEF